MSLILETYPTITRFIQYLQFEKRYSQHTIIAYSNDLEQFFTYLLSQYDAPNINEVKPIFIKSWLAEINQEGVSAKTIHRKISSVKSFFKYLQYHGLIQANPALQIAKPKISKRLPQFINNDQMHTLLHHVTFEDTWQGKTEKLVLELFYATGMRLSELINLHEWHVDAAYMQLKVLGKGNKERLIPVAPQLMQDLQSYIAEKNTLYTDKHLFLTIKGKPLTPKYVYNFVHHYLSLVTTIQQKSPHILRHTFATHLLNEGAQLGAVKDLLGHSSLAATQVYTHNTIEKLKEVFKKAHPKA